jgi:chromate transporter
MEALRGHRVLDGALAGITAAVVGVILNLSIWFALHTMFGSLEPSRIFGMRLEVPVWTTLDPGALVIAIGSFVALFRFRNALGWVLLASAAAGAAFAALR